MSLEPTIDLGLPEGGKDRPELEALRAHLDLYEFLGTEEGRHVAADAAATVVQQARSQALHRGDAHDAERALEVIRRLEAGDPAAWQYAVDAYRDVLLAAESVYLAPNFLDLVDASYESLPDFDFRVPDVAVPCGFYYFARPVELTFASVEEDELLDDPETLHVRAALVHPVADDLSDPLTEDTVMRMVYFVHVKDSHLFPENWSDRMMFTRAEDHARYRWVSVYTHQVAKGVKVTSHPNGSLKFFMAANLMMVQGAGETTRVEPTRDLRRRRQRHGPKDAPSPLDVVVAHLHRGHRRSESSGEGGSVEWSHRWMVRGHWREQWYPTEQRHRPLWIMPHVKGPEDKPLVIRDRVVTE